MFVPNSWNVIYTVKFTTPDTAHLNDEFDSREDAIAYAKEHLDLNPIVCGVECFVDDCGTVTEESEPQEIFCHKPSEEEKIPEPKLDRLAELEAELAKLSGEEKESEESKKESDESDESEKSSENLADVVAAVEAELAKEEPEDVDPYGFAGGIEIPEVTACVDPFACDFSDISKDEADYAAVQDGVLDPTAFLKTVADELGVGDKVMITPVETPEIPEVRRVELVKDDTIDFPEPTKDVVGLPSKVDFTLGDDLVEPKTEIVVAAEVPTEVAANLTDETPVTVAVAPEAESAVKFSNPLPDATPCAMEAPAEKISVCAPCPECGKEVCIPVNEAVDIHIEDNEVRIADASGEDVGIIPIDPEKENSEELTEESELSKHQKIADEFRASITKESLEGTVDKDLADDRTPIQWPAEEETELTDGNEVRKHEKVIEAAGEHNPDDPATDTLDSEADAVSETSLPEYEYTCVFDGVEVGTIMATDEDDAYRKMQSEWPDLPYGLYDGVAEVTCTNCDDDDMSDVELAQKLEDYKNNK